MISLSKGRAAQGGDSNPILHGSDVPKNIQQISVKVDGVREAPENWKAVVLLDVKYKGALWTLPINASNSKKIEARYGDDAEKLIGKTLKFDIVLVNNPQTHQPARGFTFAG